MDLSKPYNSAAFCSLSSLYDANKYFEDHDGLSAVENHLKPLFLNHGVVDKFGVALVHRHFDLDDGKVLVEKDLTTTPWRVGASFEKHGGNVIPSSWFYSDDNPTPYEFNFVPFSKEIPPRLEDHRHFVEEFFNIVKQHGLQKVIGLRRSFGCDPAQMLECTEGDTNILFLGNEVGGWS